MLLTQRVVRCLRSLYRSESAPSHARVRSESYLSQLRVISGSDPNHAQVTHESCVPVMSHWCPTGLPESGPSVPSLTRVLPESYRSCTRSRTRSRTRVLPESDRSCTRSLTGVVLELYPESYPSLTGVVPGVVPELYPESYRSCTRVIPESYRSRTRSGRGARMTAGAGDGPRHESARPAGPGRPADTRCLFTPAKRALHGLFAWRAQQLTAAK